MELTAGDCRVAALLAMTGGAALLATTGESHREARRAVAILPGMGLAAGDCRVAALLAMTGGAALLAMTGPSHPLEALHILFVSLYALLVGYLITDYSRVGTAPLLLGTIALTLHFLGADHVVLERYGKLYDRFIRWLLVGATLTGACIGLLITLRPTAFALWFGFLAGAIIVNVLEEELPEGRHANFWAFFAGALLFSALTLGLQFSAV